MDSRLSLSTTSYDPITAATMYGSYGYSEVRSVQDVRTEYVSICMMETVISNNGTMVDSNLCLREINTGYVGETDSWTSETCSRRLDTRRIFLWVEV
jgi:hypothetical protein